MTCAYPTPFVDMYLNHNIQLDTSVESGTNAILAVEDLQAEGPDHVEQPGDPSNMQTNKFCCCECGHPLQQQHPVLQLLSTKPSMHGI